MINLIPNQEKKKKVKDFYFRLTVTSLFVLGICMLFGSVVLMPSYFLSSVRKNFNETRFQSQKNEVVSLVDKNTLDIVDDLDFKLNLIENADKNKYIVSQQLINTIILKKMPDIKITKITYEQTSTEGKKVSIRGQAESRERLLLFRQALEDDPTFQKVDLPISNFVRGSNIEFSLSLTPAL